MNKQFSALIVDDERLARKDIRSMLSEFANIHVAGEAEDVPSALEAVQRLNPDVIFLDIQMPGESGFDLLNKIDSDVNVIFITAFDEYAIRAFEINALDYLLKPVSPERLRLSIERLEQGQKSEPSELRPLTHEDRLFLMIDNRMKFLRINTIMCITAAGDYSEIISSEGIRGLAHKSMREWEQRLPESHFIRIHRSTIINMDFIDRLEEWFNYSFRVYLKHIEKPVVLSRRYVAKLKERLG
ncbi:MAG: LytR/AlgR family response regulator transcription factor [Candidatus Zhuqueibacterota bacterium]